MENFIQYSLYIADAVWLAAFIRQIRTRYVVLFLMMAIDDLLGWLVMSIGHSKTYLIAIVTLFVTFLSFFDRRVVKEHWYFFLFTIVLLLASYFVTSNWTNHIILMMVILGLVIFANTHVFYSSLSQKVIDVFSSVLILYFAVNFVRILSYSLYDYETIQSFVVSYSVLEILFGVFFVIFKADDNRLYINYKKASL